MKPIPKRIINSIFCALILIVVSGCTTGARNRMMIESMRPLMDSMKVSTKRNTDIDLVRKGMPVGLLQLDGLIEMVPDDRDLLVRGADANCGYAFSFVESENKKMAGKYYKKAKDYAIRALEQNDDFKEALSQPIDVFKQSLKTFDVEDVPALYFAASSWLLWIGHDPDNNTGLSVDLPKIKAMMDRIAVLDQNFNHGGVHILLGSYYASQPVMFGGNPQKAQFHFDEAFDISQSKYLIWHLLYAKHYATQVKDRELFVSTLNKILAAPGNLFPGCDFENQIAKMKAAKLLAEVDAYF